MKKSKFNLTHPASFTANMGSLVPFYLQETLPGDVFRMRAKSFIRAQPMLAPLMHQVNFFVQYWFVPNRILWNDWEAFITGGESGEEKPVFPTLKVTPTVSSLSDYFGIPINNKELEVNALPFRAYTEIFNTRYRDQDLQIEKPISYESGLDTTTKPDLLNCAWAKDRFTTARPFTQRGAQISVPVIPSTQTGSAYPVYSPTIDLKTLTTTKPTSVMLGTIYFNSYENVVGGTATRVSFSGPNTYEIDNSVVDTTLTSGYFLIKFRATSDYPSPGATTWTNVCSKTAYYLPFDIAWGSQPVQYSDAPVRQASSDIEIEGFNYSTTGSCPVLSCKATFLKILVSLNKKVDLGTAGAINIRDLRLAGATQRYQENSLEWGNRYEEFIQREFKVRPKDARIQRPEYIGGAKTMLQISEVLQTSEGTNTGVGTMRGHGVGGLSTMRIRFHAPEHGFIIGIMSIRPHSIYSQGLDKFWRKFTKFDYYTPEFAHIGMQEIMQSELYADGTNYDTVFGYEPRYEEYRKSPARIAGEFRGGQVLDYWNLARNFDAPPVLNGSFIEMKPSNRIFAEQSQNQFLIMLRNEVFAYRPVPKRAKNLLM